jgi:hypothetical protein
MEVQGLLFDELYYKLERRRWNLEKDIPWDTLDHSAITHDELLHIRNNCMTELSALYAEEMFIRDFYDDIDFCQFVSIWYFEEMKHYFVLREYLKQFGMEPTEDEMKSLRISFEPADPMETLALHFFGEHRLGMWYLSWKNHFKEPLISHIYETLAQDEFQHADAYYKYMIKAVKRNPAVLIKFLKVCLYMMRHPSHHPTTMHVNGEDSPSVVEKLGDPYWIESMLTKTITKDDLKRVNTRVMGLLSALSGIHLESQKDLLRLIRNLGAEVSFA